MITAIVQARLGSSRLPGKVLRPILGRPMLSLMLERVRATACLGKIVVATTTQPEDDAIARLAGQEGVACHRGSVQDVLDRYYQAAKAHGASVIVRLTADCPLQDPKVIEEIVARWEDLAGSADFLGNVYPGTYPDGLDTEVFSFEALERAWREAKVPQEREHVTPFFYATGKFRAINVAHYPNLSHHRWTVDYPEDFALAEAIFQALYKPGEVFGMEEILAFVEGEGKQFVRNGHFARNAWMQEYSRA